MLGHTLQKEMKWMHKPMLMPFEVLYLVLQSLQSKGAIEMIVVKDILIFSATISLLAGVGALLHSSSLWYGVIIFAASFFFIGFCFLVAHIEHSVKKIHHLEKQVARYEQASKDQGVLL